MKIFKIQKNRGMTYVEMIVILSIFASLSGVVVFNYNTFQSRVDIKNLSNDIGLKIVEAQKFAVSGRIPPSPQSAVFLANPTLKTSYGIYLNPSSDNKSFIFFTDLDNSKEFDGSSCPGSQECLEKITITKGNTVSGLDVFYTGDSTAHPLTDLTILFTRPNSSAIISSTTSGFTPANVNYAQISVFSPKGATALIKVYPSGKIEIR